MVASGGRRLSESWHDLARKTGVCLSLSAGQVEPSNRRATPVCHPLPPFGRLAESYAADENTRLAFLSRTREDITHSYWLLANPYSVFIRHPIRRLLAGPKSRVPLLSSPATPNGYPLSLSLSLLPSLPRSTPSATDTTLTLSHGAPLQCISPPARFHLSPDISK